MIDELFSLDDYRDSSEFTGNDTILNIWECGSTCSLVSSPDSDAKKEISIWELGSCSSLDLEIQDRNTPKRLLSFEVSQENYTATKQQFEEPLNSSSDEKAVTQKSINYTYLLIIRRVDNSNLFSGVLYNNQKISRKVLESCGRLGWFNFQPISVNSLVNYDNKDEMKVIYEWGNRPKSNSEKGKYSQAMKKKHNSFCIPKNDEDIILSPLTEKSNSNISELLLISDITAASDLTDVTNSRLPYKLFSDVSDLMYTSNICSICSKTIGKSEGKCDHSIHSGGQVIVQMYENHIYGYPDQLNLACVDNICFVVMVTLHFLDMIGRERFERTNPDLYFNLCNLLSQNQLPIVLKSQLINLIGHHIKLNGVPVNYFDNLKRHLDIDYSIGIDAVFTCFIGQDNIFDVHIKRDYSCHHCVNIISSETVHYRTLKFDSRYKSKFKFTDIFKHNAISGINTYCEKCGNLPSICKSTIVSDPVFIVINYTAKDMDNNNLLTNTSKDSIMSEIIENEDDIQYTLIGYLYCENFEFFSRTYDLFHNKIIEYNGKRHFGEAQNVRRKSFTIPDEGLGIYINNKYCDRQKFVIDTYDDIEEMDVSIVSKRNRMQKYITVDDLYVAPSTYMTKGLTGIGNGLFCKKVILENTRFPYFEGDVISVEAYANKPLKEVGYGFEIIKNQTVLDCYSESNMCIASYANDPTNLLHIKLRTKAEANTICKKIEQKDSKGNFLFFLEAIKQIQIDEEILWVYRNDDRFFS